MTDEVASATKSGHQLMLMHSAVILLTKERCGYSVLERVNQLAVVTREGKERSGVGGVAARHVG